MMGSVDVRRIGLFAREDARDAIRERQAHLVGALFVLIGAGVAYSAGRSTSWAPPGQTIELVPRLLVPFTLLIPLVALGFVAPALAEKRTNGALTLVLGLPFARHTVILGTALGRSAVVGAGTLAGVVSALPIALLMGVSVDAVRAIGVTVALIVLSTTFVAIAVAISATARTTTRASFAAFGTYVVFVFQLWEYIPVFVLYVLRGFEMPSSIPTWGAFVRTLNPIRAFTNAIAPLVDGAGAGFVTPPTDPAFFERPVFAIAILFGWIVVAVGLGCWRFETVDL